MATSIRYRVKFLFACYVTVSSVVACSGNSGNSGSDGTVGTGGVVTIVPSGGASTTGGTSAIGGTGATNGGRSTGGAPATGGALGVGGTRNGGGTNATGAASTGAATNTGGSQSVGGMTTSAGGTMSTGGTVSFGGVSSAGGTRSAGGTVSSGGISSTRSAGGTPSTGGAISTGGTATSTGGNSAPGCTGSLTAEDPSVYNARRPSKSNRYLPLSIGAHWGWQETDVATGTTGARQAWVASLDTLTGTKSGVSAFRVNSTTLKGGAVGWQQDANTAVVRHRTQDLDLTGAISTTHELVPSKLHLDEVAAHITAGASWTETYADTKTTLLTGVVVTATVSVTWTVEAINESVTVPAGTFLCIRVHRVEAPSAVDSNGADNVYWYARNIGKVKETGTINHELLGYCYP